MKKKKQHNPGRRKFLKIGMAAGAGTVAAGGLMSLSSFKKSESGEKVKLLTTDGKMIEVDKAHIADDLPSKKEIREGIPGRKFMMVIDLAKCKNARKCVEECQEFHHLPSTQEWIKVHLMQDSERTAPYWLPKPCYHCDNPPCVSLCPVGATFKRRDGIVLIDNTLCIGCKFCMTGCPYSARVFNWDHIELTEEEENFEYSPERGVPQQHGTVGKCDFCPDLAREGKLPKCAAACPNGAIYYGDINEDVVYNGEELVRFSELLKDRGGYQFAEELGTDPSVYYLPPYERLFPVESGLNDIPEDVQERYKDINLEK
ncbi:4Fe-4S dicluster domain-containing protein [Bacteroidota bacterium]